MRLASFKQAIEAIASLEYFPRRYKGHPSRKLPNRIVRAILLPPFVIYYQILEQINVVEVLIVRRGARRCLGKLWGESGTRYLCFSPRTSLLSSVL